MSLTYGFYNSVDHDRRYDARQFSRLIDCLIKDGIFMHIGERMMVTAHEDHIEIGSGLAWFDSTWSCNDAPYMIALPKSDVVYTRIDAVVLEVYEEESIRANFFKIVEGTPALNPVKPDLLNLDNIHQHPLCYITRPANNELVYQSAIENAIGTSETPFVSGILETVEASALLRQWESEFDEWMDAEKLDFISWSGAQKDEFEQWMTEEKSGFDSWTSDRQNDFDQMIAADQLTFEQWSESLNNTFGEWFNEIKDTLDSNTAAKLQLQINEEEIRRILLVGFADGTKVISDDGLNITTTASDGRTLMKVFNSDFTTMQTLLRSSSGTVIAQQVKTFSSDGSHIVMEASIL